MLIERQEFRDLTNWSEDYEDAVFRYSSFTGLAIDGGHVNGEFLWCRFGDVDWHWGLFTVCLFFECRFVDCTFRGASFPDCRFVNCALVRCKFVPDLSGGDCAFVNCKWYGCDMTDCEGVPSAVAAVPNVEQTSASNEGP